MLDIPVLSFLAEIWGKSNKHVLSGQPLNKVLTTLKIAADFTYTKPQADSEVFYVHRKSGDQDIYWVDNRADRVQDLDASFRLTGKVAEIWHPETGETEKVSWKTQNGRTIADAGIKYFSGTATYSTTFTAPLANKGATLKLDLGDVKNIAEVILNGKSVDIVWKKPCFIIFKVKY